MSHSRTNSLSAISILSGLIAINPVHLAYAATIAPAFAADYTLTDLGPVSSLPEPYGGLVFAAGNPGTIYIGGTANVAAGGLYSVPVVRGVGGHITSLGAASFTATGPYNDGGFAYGPGGVLFLSQWPVNKISQYRPGLPSAAPDKVIDTAALGVAPSQASLQFIPSTFAGAGLFKGLSWSGGQFYTFGFSPDGSGLFNITSATLETTIVGGPEGFVYIKNTNPDFAMDSMLVSEFSAGNVAAYTLDAGGNPIPASRVDFITGLSGAEGAAIDPVTGDFLFSTYGTAVDHVIIVQGFQPPPPPVPEPSSLLLLGVGLAGFGLIRHRRV